MHRSDWSPEDVYIYIATCQLVIIFLYVNSISDIRPPQPSLQVEPSLIAHIISPTGCCACCSVVTVICACLLTSMKKDYAATFTGVGSQQRSEVHKQTRHVFIWSVCVGPIWTKL